MATSAAPWEERPGPRRLDVLGIGECSIDHVCRLAEMPPPESKAALLGYARLPGGQTATALLAAARLGLRGALVATVGSDAAAEEVLAPLAAAGIDLRDVQRIPGVATRLAVILVESATGERRVLGWRDPELRLAPEALPLARVAECRCLLLDGTHPEAGARAARAAREAGVPVVIDLDTVFPGVETLVQRIDFPIVSRHFAETFSQDGTVRGGLARLVGLGARLAVATLGADGCLGRSGRQEIESPGFAVSAVDTTGAGDAFHGAFVWGLLAGLAVEPLLRAANAAAALSCGAPGAQQGLPDRRTLETFLDAQRPGPWRDPDR
jgi:sulfofructose kinase